VLESKSNFIEHPELVAPAHWPLRDSGGRENVMLGTDCGYGTWVGQAAVDPDVSGAMAAMIGRRAAGVTAVLGPCRRVAGCPREFAENQPPLAPADSAGSEAP
jgi:hypothetical protein